MNRIVQAQRSLTQRLSNTGAQHCEGAEELRSLRLINKLAFMGAVLSIANAFLTWSQFGAYVLPAVYGELAYALALASLLLFNHFGYKQLAKHLGEIATIISLAFLVICFGQTPLGSFMLLATASMPMLIFNKPRVYSFYFVLHMLAFFASYFYVQRYPPIMDLHALDMEENVIFSIISMFLVVYFSNRYLTDVNNYYERKLIQSKAIIEEKQSAITDSINHALRLQRAMLPPLDRMRAHLKHFFLLYLPKDIVSGDFYWMETQGEHVYIAACDCTGHGVPGGFSSMVCHNALNRAVREFKLTDPGQILEKVDALVTEHYAHSQEKINDGMDVSLCVIHLGADGPGMQWAGANNPLWITRSGECIDYKATRRAIGGGVEAFGFETHDIPLEAGDRYYLFSDGFADQFGGPGDKRMSKKRFKESILEVCSLSADEQRRCLEEKLKAHQGETEQTDDILVMGFSLV